MNTDHYIGCFKSLDSAGLPVMQTTHIIAELTPEVCMVKCKDTGNLYAGLKVIKTGPRFTKNLKSDRNRKYISGAQMLFTKNHNLMIMSVFEHN